MSANRKVVLSGSEFESVVGYSRAVRVGPHVAVAGTTGTGPAGEVRPAATMVEVSALITPEILVEIEADAYLDPGAES
jgi:enamine deaminase RidA (YjgF/YER057c/UK114 family)